MERKEEKIARGRPRLLKRKSDRSHSDILVALKWVNKKKGGVSTGECVKSGLNCLVTPELQGSN